MTRAIASTSALVALATVLICAAATPASASGALSPLPGADACIGAAPCPWGRGILDGVNDLAVSPDGAHVYASSRRGLAVFSRQASTGKLTMLAGNDGCMGFPEASGGGRRGGSSQPAGPCGSARALGYGGAHGIAISPDGRSVYVGSVIVGDFDVVPTLVVFSRDPASGALTQLPGTAGCIVGPLAQDTNPGCATLQFLPSGDMVVAPDGKHVYWAGGSPDGTNASVTTFARGGDGALSPTSNCVSRTGQGGCARAGSSFDATELELAPAGDLLYAGGETLTALRRNADGTLAPTGNCISRTNEACAAFRTLGGASTFAVSPDGRHIYASGATSRRVVFGAIGVDPATGSLAQLSGGDTCLTNNAEGGGCTVVDTVGELNNPLVSTDGENVYAKTRSGIISLERKSDGTIAPITGLAGCVSWEGGDCTQVLLSDANTLAASPDGRHVYAGGTGGVSAFERVPGVKLPGTGATLGTLQAQVQGALVRVPVECRSDARCKGSVRILARGAKAAAARPAVLGSGSYSIAPGREAKVKVKLTARGRAQVGRAKRTKVVVETTSRVAGRTVTNRATVTLRR